MSDFFLHLLFAIGGGLGATARHFVSQLVKHQFPLATLLVNVVGCFFLGAMMTLMHSDSVGISAHWDRLAIGFCGGFTTFSSFALQTLELPDRLGWMYPVLNVLVSLVLCLLAFGLATIAFS